MEELRSIFSDQDLIIIFEAARVALGDENIAEVLGDRMDLPMEELDGILVKLEEAMGAL